MMSPIRVFHLVRALDIGGLERVVIDLVNGSRKHDVEPYLGCLSHEGERCREAQARDVWVGNLGKRSKPSVIRSLCRFLKSRQISLIHSHNPHPHCAGAVASLLTGIPLVHTKHGRNYPDKPRWVWLSRQLSRFTKKIVAVSDDIAKVVTDIEKVPGEKVMVIKNGISTHRFSQCSRDQKSEVRGRLGITKNTFVIGSVGRLSPEKNYPLLIRAFASLRSQRSAVGGQKSIDGKLRTKNQEPGTKQKLMLLLIGDGPDREKIDSLIRELEIGDSVIIPGMQEDIVSWLRAMDIFCLSSLSEGTSITLLEAGACGLPAVVTDVGGNREIVEDRVSGIVVPSRDERALSDALEELIGDSAMREKMGAAAGKRIEMIYSVEKMIKEYAELYGTILEKSK